VDLRSSKQLFRKGDSQMNIIWFLLIGLIAGWLAGKIMKGGGYDVIRDIIVGVISAVLGGFLFDLLGISAGGLLGSIVTALVGAIVFIYLLRVLRRAKSTDISFDMRVRFTSTLMV
jgi:uncharacterized membrane protein YeaQ/YmgE (transglycosylase-associated protein family)